MPASPLSRGRAGTRRASTFWRLALGLAAVAALAAGCAQSPPLTNVRQIVARSTEAMKTVHSVHFRATAIGQMVVGAEPSEAPSPQASDQASAEASAAASDTTVPTVGPSPSATASPVPTAVSTAVPLDNTYAEGDVDFAAGVAKVTGQVPALADFGGEVIVVGSDAFLRLPGQTVYHHVQSSDLLFNPADGNAAPVIVEGLLQLATDSRTKPHLVGTEACPEGACYHVTVEITKSVAAEKLGDAGTAFGSGTLDLWILQDGFRVARAEFTSTDPTAGALKARLELTRFNKPVSIQAPPPSAVDDGT